MTTNLGEQLPDLTPGHAESASFSNEAKSIPGAVLRIPVSVQIVIGSTRLPLSQVARLAPGTTLTLEERLGSPVRMLVNGREVALGDLYVVDEADGRLGITITSVAGPSADP
ncbi:MAG: FliM/FliN family flagellar motor switch protein [Aestuariivirga sp.]|uniref:FliM/FliN family flagellar motor switch protein n=1 Tax=Aestuariivirga sp. TaxID=2650926 RepID=UPI003018B534